MDEASAKLEFQTADRGERKKLLASWVAELNVAGHDPASEAFDRWLTARLDEFDQEQAASVDREQLRRKLNEWLSTADLSGGPEQEQDPTRPHPARWHGNTPSSKI